LILDCRRERLFTDFQADNLQSERVWEAMAFCNPQSKIHNRRREAPSHENPKSTGLALPL
jgi:hypothetical protein